MTLTLILIVITTGISLLALNNSEITRKLIFDPQIIQEKKEWWRFVTCGFLHADFFHLFINMFVLYSFGQAVEYYYARTFGDAAPILYLLLYLSSIFAANVSTFYKYRQVSGYRSLGASGAVSAIVFTTILYNPYNKIYLYGLIGFPGILLGIAYLIYSWYMSKRQGDRINHEAHFYGAIFGMLFTLAFKPVLLLHFINQLLNF